MNASATTEASPAIPPGRSDRPTLTWLAVAAWGGVTVALLLIFFVAREADVAMGSQLQRIFYVHVPSA